MIVMQPVLEVYAFDGFSLWPVAEVESYGYLPLNGQLSPAEVGTAVMRIADCNNVDPTADEPPRPADPLEASLHGLLTMEDLFASGGLRVTDTSTGVIVLPGCCSGLEEWRDWFLAIDGAVVSFGHDPAPGVERIDDTVRLTVDTEQNNSPSIEMNVADLRQLLAGAEKDLTDFLDLASDWATSHLPDHAGAVATAIARALDLPPKP
ncbi:hypothetical protein HNR40_007377 [Nonomuraea endophytica]|uniref:Uncharacterized protein n=2 Tax=Nonomuraea endophytica TaxID=714136 RepID=A0A7W8EKJ1_9ACTN|nr:hypothetical protein [Nonomuraea endophytica]